MIVKKRERTLFNKISLILLGVSIALAIATLFVPVISNVTLSYIEGGAEYPKTKIGFSYYFIQGWKNIVELGKLGRSNESITLVAIQLVIMIISFLIAAILITYVIVTVLKSELKDDKPANIRRSFALVSAATLQYFFVVNVLNGIKIIDTSIATDESSHFYVGTYLMIVSFVIGLVITIIDGCKNKEENRKPHNILVINSVIVILMLVMFGSNKIYMTENHSSTIFYFFLYNRDRNMSQRLMNLSFVAMIATLLSIIFLFLTYYKFLNLRKDKKERVLVVYISLYTVAALVSVFFTRFALKDYWEEFGEEIVKFGPGSYITFVFAALLLVSGILAYLIKNNIIKIKDEKIKSK